MEITSKTLQSTTYEIVAKDKVLSTNNVFTISANVTTDADDNITHIENGSIFSTNDNTLLAHFAEYNDSFDVHFIVTDVDTQMDIMRVIELFKDRAVLPDKG